MTNHVCMSVSVSVTSSITKETTCTHDLSFGFCCCGRALVHTSTSIQVHWRQVLSPYTNTSIFKSTHGGCPPQARVSWHMCCPALYSMSKLKKKLSTTLRCITHHEQKTYASDDGQCRVEKNSIFFFSDCYYSRTTTTTATPTNTAVTLGFVSWATRISRNSNATANHEHFVSAKKTCVTFATRHLSLRPCTNKTNKPPTTRSQKGNFWNSFE